jgi:type IV secretory pathway VirB10-like protein
MTTPSFVTDDECLKRLGLKTRVARRRLETYKRVQGIDGDLTNIQLADLLEVSARASSRQKSIEWAIQNRDDAGDEAPSQPSAPPQEAPFSPPPPSATKDEAVLTAELRALRLEGKRLRDDWAQLELHQKTEDVARASWENRLRHAEEEMNALWEAVELLLEKVKLTASSQAKLERRIGYSGRRNQSFQKTGKPQHAQKVLHTSSSSDAPVILETIEIQMSHPSSPESEGDDSSNLVGNQE